MREANRVKVLLEERRSTSLLWFLLYDRIPSYICTLQYVPIAVPSRVKHARGIPSLLCRVPLSSLYLHLNGSSAPGNFNCRFWKPNLDWNRNQEVLLSTSKYLIPSLWAFVASKYINSSDSVVLFIFVRTKNVGEIASSALVL